MIVPERHCNPPQLRQLSGRGPILSTFVFVVVRFGAERPAAVSLSDRFSAMRHHFAALRQCAAA
jgi:hypothetical protein